jgi:hypothetical protein
MKLTTFTSSKSQATDYYRSLGPFTRLALQKKFDTRYLSSRKERSGMTFTTLTLY